MVAKRTALIWMSGNSAVVADNRRRAADHLPQRLLRRPIPLVAQSHAPRRINALLGGIPGAHRYLEIGVNQGKTLEAVRARHRVGVDPNPRFDIEDLPRGISFHTGTSDAYFAGLDPSARFDVVFLDGLHTFA